MLEAETHPLRILGLLNGDISQPNSDAHTKYGLFFEALARRCALLAVEDIALKGIARYQNVLRSWHVSSDRWRAARRTNVWQFEQLSRRAAIVARNPGRHADLLVQHGTMFQPPCGPGMPPTVVYTDFTYRLVQRESPWRDPFTRTEDGERWNRLEHAAAHGAAMVLTRSAYARRSLIEDYGLSAERVAVVGGGVNFASLPEQASADAPRVLFIGRDFERKGGDLLLAAFARVRERLPEAELWMLTDQPVSGEGVRRIAPTYDRACIAALYRAAGVFAMPARSETWGDVFLEAMAHGLPCIGSNRDAMPEIIRHGETGFIVEPTDLDDLTQALELLLRDSATRHMIGAQGRARAVAEFTWDAVVGRMLPHFEQVRAARGSAAGQASVRPRFPEPQHAA